MAGSRDTYRAGEWVRVISKSSNSLRLYGPLRYGYSASTVDVYRLRGGGPRLKDFRVKPPYLEVAALRVKCGIGTRIEGVNRTDGSDYAGISLERCIDSYVNCNNFQLADTDPGNEYALILSSCHGGEIHGSYYAQRHGVAVGNRDQVCCVPNRDFRVFANTANARGTPSLDFGHGCSEGLIAIGGRHSGVTVGGRNMTLIGITSEKGLTEDSTLSGMCLQGGEIYGGEFNFIGCRFKSGVAVDNANGISQVVLAVLAAQGGAISFRFIDCQHQVHASDNTAIRIQAAAAPASVNVEIEGPRIIGGAGLTQFALISSSSGSLAMPILAVRGVKGLGSAVPPVATSGTVTITRCMMDPQSGTLSVNGNASASSVAGTATFPWAYPVAPTYANAVPAGTNIGGDRVIVYPSTLAAGSLTLTAMTADGGNFANTNAGFIRWEARMD